MLGTPDETIWPGVTQLPDYTSRFPRWEASNLGDVLPTFNDNAKDLISVRIKEKAREHLLRGSALEFVRMYVFFYVCRKC